MCCQNKKENQQVFISKKNKEKSSEGGLRMKGYCKKSYLDKPLVSIITVIYNGEAYIEQTILSVLNQTYDNVEYIIIDGESTDGTVDIIKKYEEKIDYWVSEKDNGIYDAMNKGIMLASGVWINLLNAGDIFCNNSVLMNVVSDLNTDSINNYGVVAGAYILERNGEKRFPEKNINHVKYGGLLSCHQAILFNKHILKDSIYYDLRYMICSDNDMMMRIVKNNIKVKYLDQAICYFQDGGISSDRTLHRKMSKEKYLAIYRNFGLFGLIKAAFYNKFFRFIK